MTCPFQIIPKDRKMTREMYKLLSRQLRVFWRKNEASFLQGWRDLMLYGRTEIFIER